MSHERHACMNHRGGVFALPDAQLHYAPDLPLEPEHLRLQLQLDVPGLRAWGEVAHTVIARRPGKHTLVLHGEALLDVDVRGALPDESLAWHYDGHELRVAFERPFEEGERRVVHVRYAVIEPSTGLLFSRPTPTAPQAPLFAATDSETERARHWMPCVDLPSARPRLDVHLRVPASYTALGPGALVGETAHEDGTKTAHWRLDAPCPSYLTCFVVGELVREDDGEEDGVPIAYFATRGFDGGHLRRAFGRTRAMLRWMTAKLGRPYPYPKYFQVALPRIGGAMENISLVTWDDRFLLDDALAAEWSRLVDQINAHEMAHSYFGDLVVIRDFAHAWLKESWATFMEQCWFEEQVSADEGRYELFMNAEAYFEEADGSYARPIVLREFSSSFDLYDRHLYPGGACRLHMLRALLGEAAFWAGARRYLARYADAVVETDDFRKVMEEASGHSLVRFFDEWFLRAGYPKLKVAHRYDPAERASFVEVEQVGAEGKAPQLFTMDLEVLFEDEKGAAQTHTLALRRARHELRVPMDKAPSVVRLDPESKLLAKFDFDPGPALLNAQLRRAGDVIGRIAAGQMLCKKGTPDGVRAVLEAFEAEPFWGVRVEWARALARVGTQASVAALTRCVELERDPRAQEGVLRAAVGVRDPALASAVEARLRGDTTLGPRARAAASEALGAQRADAPWRLLVTLTEEAEWSGFTQSGALLGLAATRRDEVREALWAATFEGRVGDRARSVAVTALARWGSTRDAATTRACAERCADLLRDPDVRVRDAAVEALVTLRAVEQEEVLRAYAATQSRQHAVRVLRAVSRLRGSVGGAAVALADETLEAMRAELRRLESELTKLQQTQSGPAGRRKRKTKSS